MKYQGKLNAQKTGRKKIASLALNRVRQKLPPFARYCPRYRKFSPKKKDLKAGWVIIKSSRPPAVVSAIVSCHDLLIVAVSKPRGRSRVRVAFSRLHFQSIETHWATVTVLQKLFDARTAPRFVDSKPLK